MKKKHTFTLDNQKGTKLSVEYGDIPDNKAEYEVRKLVKKSDFVVEKNKDNKEK